MESESQKVDCCRKRKPERSNSTPQAIRAGFWEEVATTLKLIPRLEGEGKGSTAGEGPGWGLGALESTRPVT